MASPGRPPKVPMHERPEFQAAVGQAAAMVVKELIANGIMPGVGTSAVAAGATMAPDGTSGLFKEMALSIAEIADQGTNRKRVAPQILAERQAAGERMFALLAEVQDKLKLARETGDEPTISAWTPEYRVTSKVSLNERVIEPFKLDASKQPVANEIYWTGAPSEGMAPLNAIAKKIFVDYKAWIGASVPLGETKWAPDDRSSWVTANGLVVKGDPPARRFVAPAHDFKDDLGLKTNGSDPRAPFINVLGTVAEPARQNTVQGAVG